MKRVIWMVLMPLLIAAGAYQFGRNREILGQTDSNEKHEAPALDGPLYVFPRIGGYFCRRDSSGEPVRAPLTLSIFLDSEARCHCVFDELPLLCRLDTLFSSRGQEVVVVVPPGDSTDIASGLAGEGMSLTVIPLDSSLSFERMGIPYYFMPFKVAYDSNFNAVYVRGPDGTDVDLASFERAILELSDRYAPHGSPGIEQSTFTGKGSKENRKGTKS